MIETNAKNNNDVSDGTETAFMTVEKNGGRLDGAGRKMQPRSKKGAKGEEGIQNCDCASADCIRALGGSVSPFSMLSHYV